MTHMHPGWAHRLRRSTATIAITALATALVTPVTAQAATGAPTSSSKAAAKPASTAKSAQLEAVQQARKSGKPVSVASATTATSTLTASPDGKLTLSESALPQRTYIDGAWHGLDATLVKRGDGVISPRYTTGGLHLSDGGTGPLATMIHGTDTLRITLHTPLPTPTLTGATATYENVAPGMDLVVTANIQGGFSDVFVVKDKAAATSPALANLLESTVTANGLDVTSRNGIVTAASGNGHAIFATDSMSVWDSNTTAPATNPKIDNASRTQSPDTAAVSSPASPGAYARIGAITPTLSGSTLTLAPDPGVLHGPDVTYPVDIDPTWNPTEDGWSTVAEEYPTDHEWNKTPETLGYMAVGDGVSDDSLLARSMVDFPLSMSALSGSVINSAVFSVTNEYSGACYDGGEDEQLDVDAPSQTLNSSNATWDNWDTSSDLGPQIGYNSFAYGYSPSCSSEAAAHSASVSLLTSTFSNDVAAGKTTQTLALVADDESSENSWKELIATTAQLTITYDFVPKITSMASNGKTACTSTAPALLGKGDVDLSAGVYQQDGSNLTAYFRLYNATKSIEYAPGSTVEGTTTSSSSAPATTGTDAVLQIKQSFFDAFGSGSEIPFAWTVYVSRRNHQRDKPRIHLLLHLRPHRARPTHCRRRQRKGLPNRLHQRGLHRRHPGNLHNLSQCQRNRPRQLPLPTQRRRTPHPRRHLRNHRH
jgi:hypothetical protein